MVLFPSKILWFCLVCLSVHLMATNSKTLTWVTDSRSILMSLQQQLRNYGMWQTSMFYWHYLVVLMFNQIKLMEIFQIKSITKLFFLSAKFLLNFSSLTVLELLQSSKKNLPKFFLERTAWLIIMLRNFLKYI